MNAFYLGLSWGTGLSLGLCVGLVAWSVMRAALVRILGPDREARNALQALIVRNELSREQIAVLERLAQYAEHFAEREV